MRPRKSFFIHYFDKTPPGIVCPHYYVFSHANGCPYSCDYCYLNLTFRGLKKPVVFSNLHRLKRDVEAWLACTRKASVLSAGELSDSLIFDRITGLTKVIVPLFAAQRKHLLLLVTKSTEIQNLRHLEPTPQVVVSFSVNAPQVARLYEAGAPQPGLRLAAAKELARRGWRIRVRLDPVIPIPGWKRHYSRLADQITKIPVETVTLGSLRFFPGLPAFAKRKTDIFSFGRDNGDPDGRLRLPEPLRLEIYSFLLSRLGGTKLGLCKETVRLHKRLSLPVTNVTCNCTLD